MISRYKAVMWDMDGTLLNTADGIYHATDLTLERLGLQYPAGFDKSSLIGPPMQDSFVKYWAMDKAKALAIANIWRDIYRDTVCEAEPYPGIMELLTRLHEQGIKQAVATNKTQDNAERVLSYFQMDKILNCIKGGSRTGKLTKSDLIRLCLAELGVGANQAVYIGDTQHDAEGAATNGVTFIGVTYGFGFKSSEMVPSIPCASVATDVCSLARLLNV